MKKLKKTAITGLLCLFLYMTACGTEKAVTMEDVVGIWALPCDLSDTMTQGFNGDYSNFTEKFGVTFLYEFAEDGTYRIYVDRTVFEDDFNKWLEAFLDYSVDMMFSKYTEAGIELSEVEQIIQTQSGYTLEEYMRHMVLDEINLDAMINALKEQGTFSLDGSKLFMTKDGQEFDINTYDTINVTDNIMTLQLPEGAEVHTELPGITYPLTLEKVN